jgi:hypothetical protein
MTTTFDAQFFSTVPTGVPALPTGTYALPITVPATQQAGCLQNTAQSAAWTCQIQPALPYQLDIDFIPGGAPTSDNEITLDYGSSAMTFLPYGAQPPQMTEAKVMELAIDSQSPERGVAWFFQAPYNKVVVLPQNALLPPSNDKRQYVAHDSSSSSFLSRKGTAQVGQNPWICYWNGTILETFIYVNQTSSYGASTSSSSSSTITSAGPSSTYSQSSQSSTAQANYGDANLLAPYPKVMKVQERRVPKGFQTIPPYCKLYVI